METGSPANFSRMGTLGVEEEFFVVDESGRPTPGSDELVYDGDPPDPLAGRIDHELFKFVIETQTPVIESLDDAGTVVRTVRERLVDYADSYGFRIASTGLHPAARWRELEHAEKPRYRSQLDRIQYPQHRNTTAGVHVHVGVDDADKAVWIANELRWYMPVFLALSANSPYWNGYDTGLASARAKIFEGLPNTGMPTAWESYAAFDEFERLMLETGSIRDRGELWWDVRPHTGHGTVEIRAPDAQANASVVLAFVEYAHALVLDLAERYEERTDPWAAYRSAGQHGGGDGAAAVPRRELLDENKWRATRHGHGASFVRPDGRGEVELADLVDRECERLGVSGIRAVYEAGSGAERQRRLLAEDGLDALCEALVL